ncbi:26101_t:CDS:1, partial [Gigaspora margarita]
RNNDKGKVVQPMTYSKAVKGTTKDKYMFISSDWKCAVIKNRICDNGIEFDNET